MSSAVAAAINFDDLRQLARRRLPKIAFDFIEGGLDDEHGIARNYSSFQDVCLVPRYGIDVATRDQSTELFGRTYASPVGIAPTGLAGLFRPGVDLMLARAARDANVPFIMSGVSTGLIEDLGRIAPEHGWYQLYCAKDRTISEDQVKRAQDAGLSTLVITVDVPVGSKRERNMRNGFTRPLKMTLKTKLEACMHPGWLAEYARTGMPLFCNWAKYAPAGATPDQVAEFVSQQTPSPCTWADIEKFRRQWKGNLVIKGIMHPDDAVRCAALGVDGIMVSNHGGRQLDKSPGPIEVLPAIVAAAGEKLTVMYDSGIRRGSDIVAALCLGAKFVFVGRATLYGAAAAGIPGAARALDIFRDEIDRTMAQIGAPDIRSLGPQHLFWEQTENLKRNWRG
ncbi:MAG: alpha-hydroxy-acid oxidizing protein [Hyphomicrobiales bacterium]|nr:MAG: alpha-hydroxy-acid oxidizing protein [Hyphomicrobiales bacterium]